MEDRRKFCVRGLVDHRAMTNVSSNFSRAGHPSRHLGLRFAHQGRIILAPCRRPRDILCGSARETARQEVKDRLDKLEDRQQVLENREFDRDLDDS